MAKNMDPTLEELRREQAKMRAAQVQKEQKLLTALEELGHEQALMRAAQAKKEQKPLTAITVALAGRENSLKIAPQRPQIRDQNLNEDKLRMPFQEVKRQNPIMSSLRQSERRMAPNMGGLGLAERNETELQAARRALSQIQEGRAKRAIEDLSTIVVPHFQDSLVPLKYSEDAFSKRGPNITMLNGSRQLSSAGNNVRNNKLQNSGNFNLDPLTLNKAISNYEQEMAYENLTPDLEAELKRSLTMAHNIAETNPELAYAILEYVASKGQAIEYDLNLLREKQSILQTWLTDLRRQSSRVLSKNSGASQEAIKTIIEQQAIIDSELKKVEAQIRHMKTHGMKEAEMKYPFYSTLTKEGKNSILNNLAENIADYYQEVWYNIDESKARQLWLNLYPALSTISTINQADRSFPINFSNTAGKEAFFNLKKDRDVFSIDGYIIDQRKLTGVGYSLFGSSPGNGCGWISAYNALKVLGEEPEPYNVMREVESGALLAGLAGTDPLYLVRFFRSKGYNAEIYVTKEDVERETLSADATILVYGYAYNGGIGAHFITGYPMHNGSTDMRFFNDGYTKEDYTGPIDAHYRNYDIFRFAICINKP